MEPMMESPNFVNNSPPSLQSSINHGPAHEYAYSMVYNYIAGMTFWSGSFTLILALIIYDQLAYIWKKGPIAGPRLKIPFMGPFMESVNPKFEQYLAKWNSGDLSCVSVFHKFVVIASSRDLARKVLGSPVYVKPCVVDIAVKLLRPTNFVFLDGKEHVEFRRGLNGLFTRKAMNIYLSGQEAIYDRYFKRWIEMSKDNKPKPFMHEFRDINVALSCRTFVGHYISDEAVATITESYVCITAALELVNFPLILPYTKPWYGKKAADFVLKTFEECAASAKENMSIPGAKPDSIVDQWVKQMIESREWEARAERGEVALKGPDAPTLIRDFTNREISEALFAFLFASQDATSSATTWLFQLMADNPHILDKVREEALTCRGGEINQPMNMDILDTLTYTRACVKESLRYRPPVLMVPYAVKKDFPVTPGYTIPKGSMVVPTLYPALHDPAVYPDPDTYNPDRWITGTAEKQSKNWLVFGTGPHYCLGQHYAIANLMAMLSKASLHLDWHHTPTEDSEKIKVFATIFPEDDCHLVFKPRTELYA